MFYIISFSFFEILCVLLMISILQSVLAAVKHSTATCNHRHIWMAHLPLLSEIQICHDLASVLQNTNKTPLIRVSNKPFLDTNRQTQGQSSWISALCWILLNPWDPALS